MTPDKIAMSGTPRTDKVLEEAKVNNFAYKALPKKLEALARELERELQTSDAKPSTLVEAS